MKKIMMIFLMLFVMVSMVSTFEIYPSNIEMIKGETIADNPELILSYAKSKEEVKVYVNEYYVAFLNGFSVGQQFIVELKTSNFIFPHTLPTDEEGRAYVPRRRMVFYSKYIEDVNFEMDRFVEDVYVDEEGLIYIDSSDHGKCILMPITSNNYPFIDR